MVRATHLDSYLSADLDAPQKPPGDIVQRVSIWRTCVAYKQGTCTIILCCIGSIIIHINNVERLGTCVRVRVCEGGGYGAWALRVNCQHSCLIDVLKSCMHSRTSNTHPSTATDTHRPSSIHRPPLPNTPYSQHTNPKILLTFLLRSAWLVT